MQLNVYVEALCRFDTCMKYFMPTVLCMLNQVMQSHGVRNVVFSSSATVYGDPQKLPIDEQHPVGGCTNPYGKTKYFIEEMIRDQCIAEKVSYPSIMTLSVYR